MQGIIQKGQDLRGADLEEIRRVLTELIQELRFRFSALSKENFGEQDLKELAAEILSDGKTKITVEDGKISIEAEEIIINGDVWINGSPV